MAGRRRLTTEREGSPNLYCNFTVHGRRFRGCLGTGDEDEAEILADAIRRDALLRKATGKKPEMALSAAALRYVAEHGQHLPTADDIARYSKMIVRELGAATLLSEITASEVSRMVARLRDGRANGSVNRITGHLRSVLSRARESWEVEVATLPWRKLLLDEPAEREHVLSKTEEVALFAQLRPDFHGMVRFALVTGARLENCIGLTWRQVDWEAGIIRFRIKSRKPGGEPHVLPITPAVAAILATERGRHKLKVFTYVCARNRFDPKRRVTQRKGERYPFTKDGWRRAWATALGTAGIEDFRFHDLRHTAGTRALRAGKNLRTVSKMLGHKDLNTTLRYTRTDVADIRAAMEAVETQASHIAAVDDEKKEDGSAR